MTDQPLLVNSIYPLKYFTLPGVQTINYPDNFWWSSLERYAAVQADNPGNYLTIANGGIPTSEILELDLGRIREINYINMDVLRAPFDITIEYDGISDPSRDALWLPVAAIPGQLFDNHSTYDANNRTAWLNTEFNFTDPKGNMVHARYLRLTFTRRDEGWPTGNTLAFPWPIFVKHMRVGRYVSELLDTVGPLLTQDTPVDLVEQDLVLSPDAINSRELRQQFIIPYDSQRAGQIPNLLGFGILIETPEGGNGPFTLGGDQTPYSENVQIGWSVWKTTDLDEGDRIYTQLLAGTETVSLVDGTTWLDWYLDPGQIIPGQLHEVQAPAIYELRVWSENLTACSIMFTHAPNGLSSISIPGTLFPTTGSTSVDTSLDLTDGGNWPLGATALAQGDTIVFTDTPDHVYTVNAITGSSITLNIPSSEGDGGTPTSAALVYPFSSWIGGEYVPDPTQNLVMRVWADIADEGQDVLGNAYRYVVRQQTADTVTQNDAAGWMSEPVPSPEAVEALYFDVRGVDDDTQQFIYKIIDSVSIAPRTPGVMMNVYYTQQNLQGAKPTSVDDWDYLLWTPVQTSYPLRRNEIINFPQPFQASFVKLEFSGLSPLPYSLPTFPPLPPKTFRRFPTWVEDQFNNTQVRNVIQSWFLTNASSVQTNVLQSLSDPIQEFMYEQQVFLAALALGTITDAATINSGIVDVADKAIIDPTTASKIYISFSNQYQNSLLLSVDQGTVLGQAVAARYNPTTLTDPTEATAASVVQGAVPVVSTTNDRLTESYQNLAQTPMWFNQTSRHVYTIDSGEFNKKAYFVGIQEVTFYRTDPTVPFDDVLIIDNLYNDDLLASNTFERQQGGQIPDGTLVYVSYSINPDIADEAVFLSGFEPVQLAVTGGPAFNVVVYAQPNKQGAQYFQDQDYDLYYGLDDRGGLANFIQRTQLSNRLTVPRQPVIYVDAATVIGVANIPSPFGVDSGVVIGKAQPSAVDLGPFQPDYGAGTYGGGTYGDLTKIVTDSSTVTSVAVPSGTESHQETEAGTVIGVAIITAVETDP